jgi:hypothetical protein
MIASARREGLICMVVHGTAIPRKGRDLMNHDDDGR